MLRTFPFGLIGEEVAGIMLRTFPFGLIGEEVAGIARATA
jgi:hypothetical protein